MTPLPDTLLFMCIVALASFIQAVTGFGFTLLALGILSLFMDLREASVALAPAGLMLNLILFFQLRAHFSWKGLAPLATAMVIGVPMGALLLLNVNLVVLEIALALVMFATTAQGLYAARSPVQEPWHPIAAGIPCGLAGGLLTGAFGTGGPPVVSFVLNRTTNRLQYVAAVQALFAISSGVRVAQFIALGQLDRNNLTVILPAIGAIVAGVYFGTRMLHRMSDRLTRQIVLWFVFACGLRYLWLALR